MSSLRFAAALLFAFAGGSADAAVLYRSVSPEGTIQFTDLPPEKTARRVERIVMPDSSSPASSGAPTTLAGGMAREDPLQADLAVQRASMQVDMAEHALAEARRGAGETDPMRMVSTRMSRGDFDRVAFYKKDVLLARAQLLEVLKEKRKAVPQMLTASNEWVAVIPAARR